MSTLLIQFAVKQADRVRRRTIFSGSSGKNVASLVTEQTRLAINGSRTFSFATSLVLHLQDTAQLTWQAGSNSGVAFETRGLFALPGPGTITVTNTLGSASPDNSIGVAVVHD